MVFRAIYPLLNVRYTNREVLITSLRNVSDFFNSSRMPTRPKLYKQLRMDGLPHYRLPVEILEYESGKELSNSLKDKLTKWENNKSLMRANETDYIESFRLMIHLEESAELTDVEKCNQTDVKLHHVDDNEFYFVVEPRMKDLYAMTKQFDEFELQSKDGSRITNGQIIFKENNKIYVDLESITDCHPDQLYDIVFRINRTFYLLQHQTLDLVRSHKLFDLLINNPTYYSDCKREVIKQHCKPKSPIATTMDLNDEQEEAVVNIVQGEYHPLPYLLYGPPGTGKTKTLVASILNIVETSDDNVLVCVQSNAACDEITVRLKQFLDESVMFRMYSRSKDMEQVTKSIITFSNYFGGELKFPPLEYIYKYRIVICTLATAGCLTRAHCNPRHFNYIIIDECASAVETIALIPIVGLSTTGGIHAKIVLAGDPKQLDAYAKSQTAAKLGYGTSFLEQLFNFALYKRDAVSGRFNTKYITQLVKNYRSHPAILHVSNQLFYEGALKAEVSPQIADLNINLPKLNPDFPIIFKSVQGLCIQPDDDTSSYNADEIVEVMAFIRTLLGTSSRLKQSDIGVISPYRLQCEFINLTCKQNGFQDITVGTAEKFQGQERKVIIASTVCSRNEILGSFVSDPQRFNVMITRAQYLLVIVGDPHTLCTNPNWYEFIKFCYTNGSLIQSDNHFRLDDSKEKLFLC